MIAAMAFTVLSPAAGVVLEVETVALSALRELPSTEASDPDPGQQPTVSDMPDGVGADSSTTFSAASTRARIRPTGLWIEDLGRSDVVRPVGLEDNGEMEIPNVYEVGWYFHGAVPGRPGATVLVAHVWWNGTRGPFHRLGALDLGAQIEVRVDDGAIHVYEVVERTMYDKDSLPSHLWRNSGPETLVLITCGGEFDSETRRYEQNIVVYALPAGEVSEAPQ